MNLEFNTHNWKKKGKFLEYSIVNYIEKKEIANNISKSITDDYLINSNI